VSEKINHPQHYGGDTTYECIKVIEAWGVDEMTPTSGFNLGNALKYIARLGKKGDPLMTDLQKIQWYVNREVENQAKRQEEAAEGFANVREQFLKAIDGRYPQPVPQEPIFVGMDPGAEWTSQPLGSVEEVLDTVHPSIHEHQIPSVWTGRDFHDPKPNFYDTPSEDPIVRTTYMFDREAGHNVPAYEHKSGRISLDGDTTV
jgi:hypothetical protein